MACRRFALRLLAYADSCGAGEELVGDLLEEIARGRSQTWLWQQVIGLYTFALTAYVRSRARVTPPMIACALGLLLFAASELGSLSHVVEAWLLFYYVTGTLSLFAHMASHIVRARVTPEGAESPFEQSSRR